VINKSGVSVSLEEHLLIYLFLPLFQFLPTARAPQHGCAANRAQLLLGAPVVTLALYKARYINWRQSLGYTLVTIASPSLNTTHLAQTHNLQRTSPQNVI